MKNQPTVRFPFHIVVIYCLTSAAWILLSDLLVERFVPPVHYGVISIIKGWLFVFATTAILALLLRRQQLTQAALERRMREIVDNLPSVLYVFDRDGRSMLFNRTMVTLCGLDGVSYRGRTREELGISPEAAAEHRANDLRVFETGQPIVAEEGNLQADGPHTYLTVKFPLTADDGSIEAVCGISTDITERKQAEEELEKLQRQLNQSQKMEALGQLAGGVAHDFNNILSVIMGYGHMLKMGTGLDNRQQEKVDHIIDAAEKAVQLTGGLLAFSRRQVLTPKTVNLNDIIQNLQKFLTRVIGEDIHLKTILKGVDLPVSVDSGQVEQALINLATNARDAMPQGGLLTFETGIQQIDAYFTHAHGYGQEGSYAVVTVADTGCGMDDETRKKIFEPFFTTKERGKGTGLGLAIVYGIVKQHNGFINVYSEPGKGTTCRIYLPLAPQESLPAEKPAGVAPPRGGSETILVAEDEPNVREMVTGILMDYGYNVLQARDGREAVEQFVAQRDQIALILMDVIMPGQSGKAAADEIRLLQPDARILFSSGYTADFIRNRGVLDNGMELIMKPFQPQELLRKIREMLDR